MMLRERYRRPTMAVLLQGASGPPLPAGLDYWGQKAGGGVGHALPQPAAPPHCCRSVPRDGVIATGLQQHGWGQGG